jgi:hypothetical protein
MGSDSGKRSDAKVSVLKEIDGVTRALKVAMFQLEGMVDLIRDELRATRSQEGNQQSQGETSWDPELEAVISVEVADEVAEKDTPAVQEGASTKKVSMLDILDRIPPEDHSEAGFTSEVFHDLLKRLEDELTDFHRKIDSATTWVRHLREKT